MTVAQSESVITLGKNGKLGDGDNGKKVYKWEIAWVNLILLTLIHAGGIYGATLRWELSYGAMFYIKFISSIASLGVTGGAHRLWSHRSYKANNICQIVLATMMSMTYQNSIYTWSRDHRMHHKYSETDADPHNAKRGFFFSHMGWLMLRKHPELKAKKNKIDMSDLEANPIVMFQHKHYYWCVFTMSVGLPMLVLMYYFQLSFKVAFFYGVLHRYIVGVNLTWCINSLAHLYGPKPFNKGIGPRENQIMRYMGFGEGFHNYHHTFPWDYKAAEFGSDSRNVTTYMIDFFAWLGWVTDRQVVKKEVIQMKMEKTGDGNHEDRATGTIHFLVDIPKDRLVQIRNLGVVLLWVYLV